jgi:hypothetical protein
MYFEGSDWVFRPPPLSCYAILSRRMASDIAEISIGSRNIRRDLYSWTLSLTTNTEMCISVIAINIAID